MRRLIYIALALVAICMVATGCRTTTEYVYRHDTLTVERAVVQEVMRHDTTTIHDDTERIEERVIYDTLERVKEVVRVQFRNKYIKEQGAMQTQVVHDTITIQQGSEDLKEKHSEPTRPSRTAIMLAVIGVTLGIGSFIAILKSEHW